MAVISRADVEHVAWLARLELAEAEVDSFTEQLNDILGHIAMLNELDTADVEPTAHAMPLRNVLRADEVRPSFDRAALLANAPDPVDGQFRVPKIVGEESEA